MAHGPRVRSKKLLLALVACAAVPFALAVGETDAESSVHMRPVPNVLEAALDDRVLGTGAGKMQPVHSSAVIGAPDNICEATVLRRRQHQ